MINKKLFSDLLEKSQKYYLMREEVVRQARNILKMSKRAIFLMHRDSDKEAEKILVEAEIVLLDLKKEFSDSILSEGSFREGAEEFVEAKMFLEFLETGSVDFQAKVDFDFSIMVPGICDVTGEILRKAVILVTKGDREKIVDYKNAAEEIVGELMKFDLTGKMRYKFDEAKRNLKRLEEVLYDVEIRR